MNRALEIRLRWLLLACLVAASLLAARSDPRSVTPPGLHLMPPHPELIEKSRTEGLFISESDKLERGIDVPQAIPNPPSGEFSLLVVLVDFEDNQAVISPQDFDELFFFDAFNYTSVADYYDEISYGSLALNTADFPSELGWQRAPNDYSFYVNYEGTNPSDDYGWGDYPHNLQGIVADILPLIDDQIDFTQYDNDGDGFADGVVFVHAGEGAEETGEPVDIWSATWDMSSGNGPGPIMTEDGVYVDDFSFGPETFDNGSPMTLGVFAHELGHLLFGLPDLYDLDDSSWGVGDWSLMSYGAWLGNPAGSKPAWPDAWSRTRMGFEDPGMITQNSAGYEFLPVELNPGNVVKLWTPNLGDDEYFLVEYREQVGYDEDLPGNGLLVWHVDEARWNRWELNQVECQESPCCNCKGEHPLLGLKQADGDLDLESHANRGDAGDPFPVVGNNSFNFGTNPESGSYYANACPEDSCIAVNNITPTNGSISADLNVICREQGACVNILADRMLGWGEAGEGTVYQASIQNCGNADDTFTLSYESAWLAELFDLESGEPITATEIEVSAGAAWEVGISVTVPAKALWNAADVLSLMVASANDASISTTAQLTTTVPYCTLVVDDDRGAPDVEMAYLDSLANNGFDFDVWDTQLNGSPDASTLAAHKAVVWFTGTPISNTLTPQDELGLMSYLEGGGDFFLSSQEYLTDTLRNYFGRQYLRVSTFRDNAGLQVVSGVPGNPLSDGLGPYTLSETATQSDQVNPLDDTLSAFTDEEGITNAITYDPGSWRMLFLGWPFENLEKADGEEFMASTLSWFEVPPRPLVSYEPSALAVCEGQAITFTNTSSYATDYLWSFGDGLTSTLTNTVHVYSDALTATVALTGTNCCGYAAAAQAIRVHDTPEAGFLPSADLVYIHRPVAFTPMNIETTTLTYTWNFGDGTGDFRETNPIPKIHKFTRSGWYTVTLTTNNEHCTGVASMSIYVNPLIYLPITLNNPDWRASPTGMGRGD